MAANGLTGLRDVLIPPPRAVCGSAGRWYWLACRDGSDPITRRLGALAMTAIGAHEGLLRLAIHRPRYRDEPGLATERDVATAGANLQDAAAAARACGARGVRPYVMAFEE